MYLRAEDGPRNLLPRTDNVKLPLKIRALSPFTIGADLVDSDDLERIEKTLWLTDYLSSIPAALR